ncbi:MAG: formylglycine-generating enzyme family protein [Spirulina sp. SIO3F2]|nr:formylglycine-generating enzyme family protein [Spirulina sp. SIO3F2]
MARELASLLAAAPVITLPIVRLVQRAMLPRSSAVQVAEVFMSGLLKANRKTASKNENPERLAYQLVDEEARSLLLEDLPTIDGVIVIEKVSNYVAKQLGKTLEEFSVLLRTPATGDETFAETQFLQAFAKVTASVLRSFGGELAAIADQLAPSPVESTVEPDPWATLALTEREYEVAEIVSFPPLQDFEYEVVEIEAVLERFEFEAATVDIRLIFPSKLLEPLNVQIERRQAASWGYSEPLSDEVNLDMVAIPAGRFQMGAPESEPESLSRERPQHEVAVQRFYCGRYPITQAQWRIVVGYQKVERELRADPSGFKGDERPVENVSWEDAVEFCKRLSQQTGRIYRLPSEAEWEYACRAVVSDQLSVNSEQLRLEEWNERFCQPFHFGETITTDLANYDGNYTYNDGPKGEYREETTGVGQFPANAWGLHDMHGNVDEWCEDDYHDSYKGAPTDGTAWVESDRSETRRVLRGGSWCSYPRNCRSAVRDFNTRDYFFNSVGFRVVCDPPRTLLGS